MRFSIVLLATSLVLVGVPIASANEGAPDCEADQPWIGYQNTLFLRALYYSVAPGPAQTVNTCEGEHWDGQDTVQPDQQASCGGTVNANPTDLFAGVCLGPDPNTMAGDQVGTPLGVRASAKDGAAYVGVNILLVGRAATYAGGDGAAIYLRDNTDGNVLASVVSQLRITQGYVSENDCDQAAYQHGAMSTPPFPNCGRDNTAITVEHGLLA